MSTVPVALQPRDPYEFQPDEVQAAPTTFFGIMRRIGPGMILSASIVGSGELIATTTLGAEVGYAALWIILLSCVIKPAVQSVIGRYIISTGQTGAEGFNQIPGPTFRGVNWVVWAWAAMVVMTFFQIGAMFGGVGQVLHLLFPAVPVNAWVIGLMILTLWILLGGGYERIEKLATIKVALFTMLTLMCALLMARQPGSFTWEHVRSGLEFRLPGAGLTTAIAVFGITGVGASELFMYPYWCVEKGYARWTGKNDGTSSWVQRALGWTRVMNVDILASMVIYCVATVAFYMLGAGILNPRGMVPGANDMIPILSTMYTETLGGWSVWLFYVGAIATLYGTIFAATAGNCRVFADMTRLLGAFPRGDYPARQRMRNRFIWFHLIVPVLLYLVVQSPVAMVRAGGYAQALMLPVLSIGAVYMHYKGTPRSVRPGFFQTAGLWIGAVVITAVVGYTVFQSVLSLF
ncbi:MAG: Nramp family divalent metal transporter [Bryobacteraceae bacterium]|nr:Nramp family divalent metal transporter [Bryobacteraceae bacterium]